MQAIQVLMRECTLLAAQVELYADIKARAIELGYDSANVEPILKGEFSFEYRLRDKATYAFFSSFVIVMPSIISVTPFMTQPNSWPT